MSPYAENIDAVIGVVCRRHDADAAGIRTEWTTRN
jgi:hypothetical protein